MTDPYVHPSSGVLLNHFDVQDEERLARIERVVSFDAMMTLMNSDVAPGGFDLQRLREIHYALFKDVYPFAGQVRTVEMSKSERRLSGRSVAYALPEDIERVAAEGERRLCEADAAVPGGRMFWARFSEGLASIWRAHPFREGNTRAVLMFAEMFLRSRGLEVDFSVVSRDPHETRDLLVKASEGYGEGLAQLFAEARKSFQERSHPVFGLLSPEAAALLRKAAGGRTVPSRMAGDGEHVRGTILLFADGLAVLETVKGFVGIPASVLPIGSLAGDRLSVVSTAVLPARADRDASYDLGALLRIRNALLADPDAISFDDSGRCVVRYGLLDDELLAFAEANPVAVARVAERVLRSSDIENLNDWAVGHYAYRIP